MAFALDHALVTETRSHGGKILDGFGAFGKASLPFKGDTCKAGLLIHLTPTTCDIHPSPAGAALLARALHSAVKPAEH
jgi:lysophospholipase L1-like esterase